MNVVWTYVIVGVLGLASGLAFPQARAWVLVAGAVLIAVVMVLSAVIEPGDPRAERYWELYAAVAVIWFVIWAVAMFVGSAVRRRTGATPRAERLVL